MTNYREILRLSSLGINHSRIADSTTISRPTVITILQRAAAQGLDWHAVEHLSDRELALRLFPQGEGKSVYKMRARKAKHMANARSATTRTEQSRSRWRLQRTAPIPLRSDRQTAAWSYRCRRSRVLPRPPSPPSRSAARRRLRSYRRRACSFIPCGESLAHARKRRSRRKPPQQAFHGRRRWTNQTQRRMRRASPGPVIAIPTPTGFFLARRR